MVSRAGDLTLAQAHRLVASRPQAEQDDLLAFLRQLDGRQPDGTLPIAPDPLFGDGFELQ